MIEQNDDRNIFSGIVEDAYTDIRNRAASLDQHKREQREHKQSVDLVALVESFPEKIRRIIVANIGAIQFTDGCDRGCPKCGEMVQRFISKEFSLDSWLQFVDKYGDDLPEEIMLYSGSDPLVVSGVRLDGSKYDYVDLLIETKKIKPDLRIFTSTAVPPDTEKVALKLIGYYYQEWLISIQKNIKYEIPVRFSSDDENWLTIESLKTIVVSKGYNPDFVEDFFVDSNVIYHLPKSSERKIGNLVNHPDRDPLHTYDWLPIACYDGIKITPNGIYTTILEAVTLHKSPFGYQLQELKPDVDSFLIPKYVYLGDYLSYAVNNLFSQKAQQPHLLPMTHLLVCNREGRSKEVIVDSPRRCFLSFASLIEFSKWWQNGQEIQNLTQKQMLRVLYDEVNQRWLSIQPELAQEQDQETLQMINLIYKTLISNLTTATLPVNQILRDNK
jgi:hypothetical protein